MTIAIRIENLGKSYRLGQTHEYTLSQRAANVARRLVGRSYEKTVSAEVFWALRGVTLDVREGEAVAVIGANGAGKSTLLKILSRITQPTTGRALVRGRLSSLLEVGTGFHPELTGRENVFLNGTILGMRRTEVIRKFDDIVEFAGVGRFIDTPVKRYSSGMHVRLAFAVAAHLEPEVLIVDEVLAVGDAEFQRRCLGKMGEVARDGRTVLFVSHNMAAVQDLCSRAVLMQGGQVALEGGVKECVDAYLGAFCSSESARFFDRSDERIWVKRVGVSGSDGRPTSDLSFEETIRIEVEYELAQELPNLSIGLRVRTSSGVAVFTSERPTHKLGQMRPGPGRCVVEIPGEFLVPGRFLVTIGVHVPAVDVLFLEENVLSFIVHETGSKLARYASLDVGCVMASCVWSDAQPIDSVKDVEIDE